jgi:hypothetical protein
MLEAVRREVRLTGTMSQRSMNWVLGNIVRIGPVDMADLYTTLLAAQQTIAASGGRLAAGGAGLNAASARMA